ncbi:MAG: protein kinase [Aphanothece sp. CMT-3BRIN-NPC111]|jgi:WD40 repeat protein/tRNA A-37 threonylcarbamoyl transferase component Bud32|nr:protein kinase [Aphanothece sp. CMT-3BRIN-NPC111]
MSYCLNPDCQKPQNPAGNRFCQSCGSKLLLKELYRAIAPLGQGGFGRTFRAVNHGKFDEPCVIKQLLPQAQGTWALQKSVELFNQEAKRLHQLGKHPQIPELIAYFEQDQRLYLVQESIAGQNLLQELEQQGAFRENQIRELLAQMLPVLKFIHEKGVIHRDIKPENIMRRSPPDQWGAKGGELVLIDFGVSKQISRTTLARSGTTIGSQGYAPIEQMQNGKASPSGDLYSLGVTCLHLLTKIHPFQMFSKDGYSWVLNWRNYLLSPISKEIERVLEKLLRKDINYRYESADAVIEDIKAQATILAPTVIVNSAQPPAPKSQTQARTQSAIVPPTVIVNSANLPAPKPQTQAPNQSVTVPPTVVVNSAQPPAPTKSPVQGWKCVHTIKRHLYAVNCLAYSPDGGIFASGSKDNTIKLWEPSSGKQINNLTGHSSSICAIAFSPNSEILASGSSDATIKLWQTSSGKLISTLTEHSSSVDCLTFSPDNRILVSGSKDNTIKLWESSNSQLIGTLIKHSHRFCSLAFSPDGAILASGGGDNTIKLWQLKDVKLINTLTGHGYLVYVIAFSPDGQILVSGSGDNTIKLWEVNTGRLINTFKGHLGSVYAIAFSPDGQILVSGSGDNTIKLWEVNTGKLIDTLTGHSDWVNSVAFSPDGRVIVSGSSDKNIKIWRCD